MFNFEKLSVWQKATDFADFNYTAPRAYPEDERFRLPNQNGRAAVSISSNNAEGGAGSSLNEYARFLQITTGLLFEVVSQSFVSRRQDFLSEQDFQGLYAAAEEEGKTLSGLRRSVMEKS